MSDIKSVLADAEDLLKQAATATGERASELRETALTRLKQAKERERVDGGREGGGVVPSPWPAGILGGRPRTD